MRPLRSNPMQLNATCGEPATPGSEPLGDLEPARELALAAILAGKPYNGVTALAGVSRVTLWRWMTGDPKFIARYNAGRRELVDQARAELLTLASSVVKVIRRTLEQGTGDGGYKNFLAAVKTLELLGCGGS